MSKSEVGCIQSCNIERIACVDFSSPNAFVGGWSDDDAASVEVVEVLARLGEHGISLADGFTGGHVDEEICLSRDLNLRDGRSAHVHNDVLKSPKPPTMRQTESQSKVFIGSCADVWWIKQTGQLRAPVDSASKQNGGDVRRGRRAICIVVQSNPVLCESRLFFHSSYRRAVDIIVQ